MNFFFCLIISAGNHTFIEITTVHLFFMTRHSEKYIPPVNLLAFFNRFQSIHTAHQRIQGIHLCLTDVLVVLFLQRAHILCILRCNHPGIRLLRIHRIGIQRNGFRGKSHMPFQYRRSLGNCHHRYRIVLRILMSGISNYHIRVTFFHLVNEIQL